jgi:gamma-glutamylcyclotransferase (GGCT)/AIG2-like uncharacterized protein YtfP
VSSDLIQALDRLRDSVDSLRSAIEATAGQGRMRPADVYLDNLKDLRDKGLIDEGAYEKKRGFLDKI